MPQSADNSFRTARGVGHSDRPGRRTRRVLVRATPVLLTGVLAVLAVAWTSAPLSLQAAPDEGPNGVVGISLQTPNFSQTPVQHSSPASAGTVATPLTIAPALNHGRRSSATSRRSPAGSFIQIVSQSREVDGQHGGTRFSGTQVRQAADRLNVTAAQADWSTAETNVQRIAVDTRNPQPKADTPQREELSTPGLRRSVLHLPAAGRSMTEPSFHDVNHRVSDAREAPSLTHTNGPLQRPHSDLARHEPPSQAHMPQPSGEASGHVAQPFAVPQLNVSPPSYSMSQFVDPSVVPGAAAPQTSQIPFPAFRIPPSTLPEHTDPLSPAEPETAPPSRDVPGQAIPTTPIPKTQVPPIPVAPTPQLPVPGGDPSRQFPWYESQPPGFQHPAAEPLRSAEPQRSVGEYGHSFPDQDFQHDTFANDLNPSFEFPTSEFQPGIPGHVLAPGQPVFEAYPGTSGYRATVECDAPGWLSPYNQRAQSADPGQTLALISNLPGVPIHYVPWWDGQVRQSTGLSNTVVPVDVSMLLQDAMRFSPQVIAIQAEPEVQYRVITQEAAKFDWTAFLETKYDDLNDPVGNELTTGNNSDRLLVNKFRNAGGIRGRNLLGGEFRVAQEIGTERQNSRFFIPNSQGQSRLELSYRQPLLDGAGRTYNESEIILARIQANSSEDEVVRALQEHLIEITEAYWTLYRARAEFFQRQKLLTASKHVLARLEARTQVDTIPRQVLRAKAAVARSQTRIQRTLARVKDAEAQLRLLVNSPAMLNGGTTELLPLEAPHLVTETADLQSVLQTSLTNRPDISEAIRKMRASSVRLGVSRQELLPRLDFLVESYVADLAGNRDIGDALRGQFGSNRPGYTVGLEFEIPLENRAAIARNEQRQWELKRSINVFRATVEKSLTDVEIARREVATAWSEVNSHYHALLAANQEADYLMDRFAVLPATEDSATLLLEDLLDSIERVADEESAFVQAQVDHAISLVKLKKEMGILLQSRHARPAIQSPDQQWLDDRLQSAVAPTSRMAPEPRLPHASPTENPQRISTASLIHPEALMRQSPKSGGQVRPAVATQSSRPLTSEDPLRGIPVADHPTMWSRPGLAVTPE